MQTNSIGQFISALRKASGMTQQEVADRLNVSNKAVSRWERDECAPDISLIPAIAEMFGVTCDELLRGERLTAHAPQPQKSTKAEKQLRSLLRRTLATAKTLTYISIALAFLGLICMFGIAYGFYRPVIGFAVMLILECGAIVTTIIAISCAKSAKTDNELFEMAEASQVADFDRTLAKASFNAFFSIVSAVALSLPFIIVKQDYGMSVITTHSYFSIFFLPIALLLALVYLKLQEPYSVYLTTGKLPPRECDPKDKLRFKNDFIQLGLLLISAVTFVLAPYLPSEAPLTAAIIFALLCIAAAIVYFAVYFMKTRGSNLSLTLRGMRNLFFIPCTLILSKLHSVSYTSYSDQSALIRHDHFHTEYLYTALVLAAIVMVVFTLLDRTLSKKEK